MNAKSVKLKLMPYAKAHVNVYPEAQTCCLVSYRTRVIELTNSGWLYVEGIYSRTTGRHITAFLNEYAPHLKNPYQLAKQLAHDHVAFNIYTGEIKDWAAA